MLDVHAPLDPPPRAAGQARPRARGAAERRDDRRAQARAPRPDAARARDAARLHARSTSTRSCSTRTCPRTRTSRRSSRPTSRRRCPSATPSACARTGCGARSSPRRSSTTSLHGARHHLRLPPARGDRRAARPTSRAPTRSPARSSRCARSGREIEALDNLVAAETQMRDAARGPPPGRARRRAGCCATAAGRSTSPRPSSYFAPGARCALRRAPAAARARRDVEPLARQRRRAAATPACRASWRCAWRGLPHDVLDARHRRGGGRHRARRRARSPRVHFRLGSRLELHWLRDRIVALPRDDRWRALARAALRDDLYSLHRALTAEVLRRTATEGDRRRARSTPGSTRNPAAERCSADARRHPRRPRVRHDDAAGRGARGAQPDPGAGVRVRRAAGRLARRAGRRRAEVVGRAVGVAEGRAGGPRAGRRAGGRRAEVGAAPAQPARGVDREADVQVREREAGRDLQVRGDACCRARCRERR